MSPKWENSFHGGITSVYHYTYSSSKAFGSANNNVVPCPDRGGFENLLQ